MKKIIALSLISLTFLYSCKKDDKDDNTTPPPAATETPSPVGNVGTTFTFSNTTGVSNPNVEITSLSGGVSNVHMTGTVTDPNIRAILAVDQNGNFDINKKIKFTLEGITDYVFDDPSRPFTVVDYDWQVGDSVYTNFDKVAPIDSIVVRKVMYRSEIDDYNWSGQTIKTITVKEDHGGFSITYRANHKFGIVSIRVDNGQYNNETQVVGSTFNF